MGLNNWTLRPLGREGSTNMFIVPKPVLDLILKLRGSVALFLTTKPLGSSLLDPDIIRKTSPR